MENNVQVKKPFKRFENRNESITDIIEKSGKTRESVLNDLGLVPPLVKLIREQRNSKEEIKRAKRKHLLSIKSNELMIAFSNAKTPNWGGFIFNGMRINNN